MKFVVTGNIGEVFEPLNALLELEKPAYSRRAHLHSDVAEHVLKVPLTLGAVRPANDRR